MADKQSSDNLRAAQGGGVTSKEEPNVPHDIFNTSGSQPVRDRTADPSKGVPVTRYFTKDGTPVEPSTAVADVPQDRILRNDIVKAVEYTDEAGNVVTHDSLKGREAQARGDGSFSDPSDAQDA